MTKLTEWTEAEIEAAAEAIRAMLPYASTLDLARTGLGAVSRVPNGERSYIRRTKMTDRPTPPCVIGLAGCSEVGKTTLANLLATPRSVIVPFAAPIKTMLQALGVDPEQKEKTLRILQGRTTRYALQTLGTEWGRKCIGLNVWAYIWDETVHALFNSDPPPDLIIADDVRFLNEISVIRGYDGVVVYVERPDLFASSHASETSVEGKDCDWVLSNDGSLDQLKGKVDAWRRTWPTSQQ